MCSVNICILIIHHHKRKASSKKHANSHAFSLFSTALSEIASSQGGCPVARHLLIYQCCEQSKHRLAEFIFIAMGWNTCGDLAMSVAFLLTFNMHKKWGWCRVSTNTPNTKLQILLIIAHCSRFFSLKKGQLKPAEPLHCIDKMFWLFFIGPESDHCPALSTNMLTGSLTHV